MSNATIFLTLLERLRIRSPRVIDTLHFMCIFRGGCFAPLREIRARLRLRRGQLKRAFAAEGLPHPRVVQDSLRVLALLDRWDGGESLAHYALSQGEDPASFYRLVRRVTGRSWSEVRESGADQYLEGLLDEWNGLNGEDGKVA